MTVQPGSQEQEAMTMDTTGRSMLSERYGNIRVRVAGYSQMFRLVDRELQDRIIARTKHQHME